MFERFTVDSLADEIETRVKQALPTAKMTRRFYRKGKRDGRRQLACEPIASYLSEAVGIATSKIGQEHLDAALGLKRQATALAASVDELQAAVDRGELELEGLMSPPSQGDEGEGVQGPVPGETTLKGAENLEGAIPELRRKRAAAERTRAKAQLAADHQHLDQANAQLSATEKELMELPRRFRQLIVSCHKTGRFIWARYCSGYEIGKSKRGTPDDELLGAQVDVISFDYPEALEHQIQEIIRDSTGGDAATSDALVDGGPRDAAVVDA